MISIAIYSPQGLESTLNMAYAIVLVICVFGNVLMYTSVPDDPKSHGLMERASKEQQTIHAMERIIVPLALGAVIVMTLIGINAGLIFMLVGILMAPLGIIGFIDDSNITLRDNDFSTFIRSLGAIMGGQGTTAVHALATIDKKSLTTLEPLVNSVYSQMNLGLDNKQIWDKFIGDSGSNLIYKYLNIYLDTIIMGGPPEPIGTVVGSSVLEQTLLREKKDMHARSFIVLLAPMHMAMVGIFVVLFRIMLTLTGSVSSMMGKFAATAAISGGSSAGGVSAGSALGGMSMFTNFPEKEMGNFVVIISYHHYDVQYYCCTDCRWRGSVYVLFLYSAILYTDRTHTTDCTHRSEHILQPRRALEYGENNRGCSGNVPHMKESLRRVILFAVIVITGSVMILFDVPLILMIPLILAVGFVILLLLGAITVADIRGLFTRKKTKNVKKISLIQRLNDMKFFEKKPVQPETPQSVPDKKNVQPKSDAKSSAGSANYRKYCKKTRCRFPSAFIFYLTWIAAFNSQRTQ